MTQTIPARMFLTMRWARVRSRVNTPLANLILLVSPPRFASPMNGFGDKVEGAGGRGSA
ncbi:MAG: hypothetical protein WAL83_12555 [Arenicellales bacterium]